MMIEMYHPILTHYFNENRQTQVFKIAKAGTKSYVLFDRNHAEILHELLGQALERDR